MPDFKSAGNQFSFNENCFSFSAFEKHDLLCEISAVKSIYDLVSQHSLKHIQKFIWHKCKKVSFNQADF